MFGRRPGILLLLIILVLLGASVWLKGFFLDSRGFVQSGSSVPARLDSPEAVQQTYSAVIEPILRAKCFQCHTDTEERPLFYSMPVVGTHFAHDYVDGVIDEGRAQFDFSDGLPLGRIGATMEFVQGVREVGVHDSMPPLEYSLTRPSTFLTTEERGLMVSWAEAALDNMWTELDSAQTDDRGRLSAQDLDALAAAIINACPVSNRPESEAMADCSRELDEIDLLVNGMRDPFFWGQQKATDDFNFAHIRSTRFSPRVWRKLYASLFSLGPGYEIIDDGAQTILRIQAQFRGELDAGNYPYPFWHEPSKWKAYRKSEELIFVVRDGTIAGVMRGAAMRSQDPSIPLWDEHWQWTDSEGEEQPEAAILYSSVLSPTNPYIDELGSAYKQLALGLRDADCMTCHSPDNSANMKMLELFNYPNHALSARNRIVTVFDKNTMPPIIGIEDEHEREKLYQLSVTFRDLANQALRFEDRSVEDRFDRLTF